jgi:hypothetical protein
MFQAGIEGGQVGVEVGEQGNLHDRNIIAP